MLNVDEITNACVKCGKCIPTCTIHEINRDESTSPRGFLDLISAYKNQELELDRDLKTIFESCFLCTNCVEACPSHLRVDSAIEKTRYDIAQKFGIAWYKKLAFFFLRYRQVLNILARLGYVFQSCAFSTKNNNQGMKAKLNLPLIKKGRLLPSLSKKSFLSSNPDFINNQGEKSIGIFIGCLSNYSYTSTGFALLEICKHLKINVDLLKEQSCCGAPHYFTGDFKSVEHLAKKNIVYFEEKLKTLDYIIIPEATCSAMINIDYEHFFHMQGDQEWTIRAKNISHKILLTTKYLYEHTNLEQLLKTKNKANISISYHDPCHAKKMQGIYKEPRNLLKQNYHFKELIASNECCGFGGVSMQTDHYEKVLKVGMKKAHNIQKTDVQIISAECSACRMQISNALEHEKVSTKFSHPLELIAKILQD
ncbi:anaerobic glycerol-3-phosphate dehydrogenase [Campylobacter subantarcticus LMG 24377]|uniref:Glycolate oxidase iron-sulfur subunit n=1 Tax=Campylobacter subantarcticus TaxID=497724 RepID=A0ABW9N6M1_9BACT|nr:anaerobic glycerol-3-phosphate dehydrogenase [Campylobacter subantarcticus]AJC92907.1 anaerobic glycerol-3-phosphate dehydrogenase [Campylobacter subantarcticus LMG 24377]EAL3939701.1 anaerobic glycerol-3-phosphate dehydrogenase [Campylobacter lari]MPB99911.1 anaerobic glycerol-3-phosphate dehydrogenase [Campylobacter subantarcticus]